MTPLWIIGAGGHAKVVIEAALLSGQYVVAGCLDDRPDVLGTTVLGIPVVGPISEASIVANQVQHAVMAIGSNSARARIVHRLDDWLHWASVVHPRAIVSPTATIGEGTVVCAGAVVQAAAAVGRHAIVNTAASVDHDAVIGDFAHIGPGAHLAGEVVVGTGGFFGIGSTAIPMINIGDWAVVGAGAVVTRDVPDRTTVVGIPAKPIGARRETQS